MNFIRKGFVLDDERLKQGKTAFGKDYFRELLAESPFYPCKRKADLATANGYLR
jgi:hypothetical protein